MLLIYAVPLSSRLHYVCDVLFTRLLNLSWQLTDRRDDFVSYEGPRLNYSLETFDEILTIRPAALLFEKGIHQQQVTIRRRQESFDLCLRAAQNETMVFDPLAAVFYLTSRYEEYLPFQADGHGRFPEDKHLLVRHGLAQVPLLHLYARALAEELQLRYPSLRMQLPSFQFLLTYDVDLAYAYLGRPWWRTLGGLARSLTKGQWAQFSERIRVLQGKSADPYDTFALQSRWHQQYGVRPVYFFLLADYGRGNKNVSWNYPPLQTLVRHLASTAAVGLHVGYESARNPALLRKEKHRLETILNQPVVSSRLHFLRLRFPETYRHLLALGIRNDYSLGFATTTGFRAGLSVPFCWYDLENDGPTDLMLIPLVVMDATMCYYWGWREEQAAEHILTLAQTMRTQGGLLHLLVHNDLLSTSGRWPAWGQTLEHVLKTFSE